jgi:cellulose synthase/poly-beta-1,6-N-acetylglucosamine synthase-like glycosyltransferase
MAELISAKYLLSLAATSVQFQYFERWSRVADPFRGLYQFPWFVEAIKILYFVLLLIVGAYGLYRCWMVCSYFKYRHNIPGPPPPIDKWPTVTVQLPIYNELYVIERLVDAVAQFDYPRELLEIQVLDDSVDETQQVARARVEHYRAMGLSIHYLRRNDRTGFKAGNLAAGLKSASGELVAIFDADFLPEPDFLRRMVPYFADPNIAMVQARWAYLNRGYSALTQVQALMHDGHFVIEQGARSRSGVFFNFTGTAGVWRRAAIDDAGGWQHDTLTEDIDLSYRAQLRGWKLLYVPGIDCPSELLVDMNGFKAQQARWTKGSLQVARKLLPGLLRSEQRLRVKVEGFFQLTSSLNFPIMMCLFVLTLPVMNLRLFQFQGGAQALLINGWSFICSTFLLLAYSAGSQYALYPRAWKRSLLFVPHMVAVGIGLSMNNSKAALEALFGVKSDFVSTPKLGTTDKSGSSFKKSYRVRAGWMPYIDICLGLYFSSALVRAVVDGTYRVVPFLLFLVWGYLYTSVLSLGQGWWEQLRQGGRRAPSTELEVAGATKVNPAQDSGAERLPHLESAPAVEGGGESSGV